MKRPLQWLAPIIVLALTVAPVHGDIASSRHNLSVSGAAPGQTIKAATETELCAFCHIPHNANPAAPLWNHSSTVAAYTLYTSDYLTRASYVTPTDVGQRSRLCLSCHDGTVAVGSIYMLRGQPLSSAIAMSGVDAGGKMPATAAGFLGTDLRNDHPVSIKYDTGIILSFGSGSRTMELKTPAPPINPKPYQGVKLYGSVSGTIQGYVECTSCHDAHNDANSKFLVVSNTGSALCTTCHSKTGWTGSIHQTSAQAINNPAGETQPIPETTVGQAACMNCHKSHAGAGLPYLTRKTEENTCYNGTSTSCHGTSGAKKIQPLFTKAKHHPVETSGKHKNLDVLYDTDLGAGNRHAECYDCHNPHQTKNLPQRVTAGSWYPLAVDSTANQTAKSGPLTGVTGVNPTTTTLWAARTTYTTMNIATYEYQICYKCHSWYAIRNSVTPLASWGGSSSAYITDQAWEFSPGNKSAHPVETGLNNQTGSTGTRPLATVQMSAPWNTNLGTQTMYCSDCHGADSENSLDPRGPHGSNSAFLLKGPNKYWPADASGNLYTLGYNSPDTILNGLFCKNCHPIKSGSTWYNNVHSQHAGPQSCRNVACVVCHSVVPHGSKVSRLMVYQNMGAPYLFNGTGPRDGNAQGTTGNTGYLLGFRKAASRTSYGKTTCYTTSAYKTAGSGDPCSGAHGTNAGGYD